MALKPIVRVTAPAIHLIRAQRVMLDSDLAAIYRVTAQRLNEQLPRNKHGGGRAIRDPQSTIRDS